MKRWFLFLLLSVLAAVGCSCSGDETDDGDADADVDGDTDVDTDADTDTTTGSDTNTATETSTSTDAECNLAEEDGGGCSGGDCCYLDTNEEAACAPAGTATQDDPCSPEQCACGYTCTGQTKADAVCKKWCGIGPNGQNDYECEPLDLCLVSISSATNPEVILGFLCETPDQCNPLTQDDCEGGADVGCYVVDQGTGATDCYSKSESGGQGESCTFINSCSPGFQCVGDECQKICAADGGDPACDSGFVCDDQGYDVPNDTAGVGFCVPE